MKVAFFDSHRFEIESFRRELAAFSHELVFLEARLTEETAKLADGFPAVCAFVNDSLDRSTLEKLSTGGTQIVALRSAGFNHVDLEAAHHFGIKIVRVPEYSPYAVAEHAVAMMMALNRHLTRAHNRVMEQNFSLNGLTGFDMHGKTVGILGTGKIGAVVARIMNGFGCRLLGYDLMEDESLKKDFNLTYTDCETLCSQADIISLHLPLTPQSKHLINKDLISKMKDGVMLINTSRGGLVDTKAVVNALKTRKIGYFGMDVYEEEAGLFFEDHSNDILQDDTLSRLMTFKNVLITSHQGFLTETALTNIAQTTIENLTCFGEGKASGNEI